MRKPRRKVSVGIPVFNGEKYLEQAIKSVLDQTYPNLELYVFDNCSTDGTGDICRRYEDDVTYVRHEKPIGGASNWTAAFPCGDGPWCAMLCHDDFWLPNHLTQSIDFLEAHPDVGLVHCREHWVDLHGAVTSTTPRPELEPAVRPPGLAARLLIHDNDINPSSYVAPREALLKVGPFRHVESCDWDFSVRMACQFKVGYHPTPSICYRVHPDQDTHRFVRCTAPFLGHAATLEYALERWPEKFYRERKAVAKYLYQKLAAVGGGETLKRVADTLREKLNVTAAELLPDYEKELQTNASLARQVRQEPCKLTAEELVERSTQRIVHL